MNKRYTKCNQHKSASKVKEFIGVETQMLKYSAISMSAGEQKVFYILRKLYQAGKNSLILIDELDLLLHDDALKKLLDVIVKRAEEKKLQVIFTTHRESIALITDINIRHIYDSGKQTFCFKETTPDSIQRLTGTFTRLINIFVEDDVSAQIINHTCGALGIKKHVDVSRFGAASNCFAMASGLFLKTPDLENVLFVWDGDIEQYRSDDQKNTALKKVLSGDDPKIQSIRDKVRSVITEYVVDTGISPEMFIFDVIRNDLSEDTLPNDEKEIYRIVYNLPIQSDSHDYINKVLEELNEARAAGLSKIIALASKSPRWAAFISPIKTWLESKMDLCLGKK